MICCINSFSSLLSTKNQIRSIENSVIITEVPIMANHELKAIQDCNKSNDRKIIIEIKNPDTVYLKKKVFSKPKICHE